MTTTESFVTLQARTRASRTSRRTCTCAARACRWKRSIPDGRREMLSQVTDFNFNWHNMYIYADDVAPLLPKGTILHLHRVVRQHARQQVEPRSGSVGRLGRSHHRRDGPRVAEHHLLQRRGVQGRTGATRRGRQRRATTSGSAAAAGAARSDMDAAPCVRRVRRRAGWCARAPARCVRAGQQGQGQTPSPLPLSQPIRERGSSVTGAYEGWYHNKDGSISLLVGYFNRNTKQELDIPVGPNNRIEPGGPDQGQPTHFLTGRQWGVFSIKVPKDFGDEEADVDAGRQRPDQHHHAAHASRTTSSSRSRTPRARTRRR